MSAPQEEPIPPTIVGALSILAMPPSQTSTATNEKPAAPSVLRLSLTGRTIMDRDPRFATLLAEVWVERDDQPQSAGRPNSGRPFRGAKLIHHVIGPRRDLEAIETGSALAGAFLMVQGIAAENYRAIFHDTFPPNDPPYGLGGCAAFSMFTDEYGSPAVFVAMVFRDEEYLSDFLATFCSVLSNNAFATDITAATVVGFQASSEAPPQPAPVQPKPARTLPLWLNE